MSKRTINNISRDGGSDTNSLQAGAPATAVLQEQLESGRDQISRREMASLACESCRHRKSRCDEQRPKCSLCERLQLRCEYREPSIKGDRTLLHVLETVQRIEDKIDNISVPGPTTPEVQYSGSLRPLSSSSPLPPGHNPITTKSPSTINTFSMSEIETKSTSAQLAIPYFHTTAAEKLLLWPVIKRQEKLSHIDSRYPLKVEINRPPPHGTVHGGSPNMTEILEALTFEQMKRLTDYYFDDFHMSNPVINLQRFRGETLYKLYGGWYANEQKVDEEERCMSLFVFALGNLAAENRGGVLSPDAERNCGVVPNGTEVFFREAEERLGKLPKAGLKTAQCFLLCGIYHSRTLRSLDYYWAVNQACFILMVLLSSSQSLGLEGERIYWVAHMQESGIIAELGFPPSGISRFEDQVPLPFSGINDGPDPETEYQFFFLAQIALRRLLNRVHSSLYNQGLLQNESAFETLVNPSLSIINELNQQLEQWRCHLPPMLQFPPLSVDNSTWDLGTALESVGNDNQSSSHSPRANLVGPLRARYCAAKSIIYRPFAFKVLHLPPELVRSEDYRCLRTCLLGAIWIPVASRLGVERFQLLQNPMNPCRSLYAAGILARVIAGTPKLRDFLPNGWEVVYRLHQYVKTDMASKSPIIDTDVQILEIFDEVFPTQVSSEFSGAASDW